MLGISHIQIRRLFTTLRLEYADRSAHTNIFDQTVINQQSQYQGIVRLGCGRDGVDRGRALTYETMTRQGLSLHADRSGWHNAVEIVVGVTGPGATAPSLALVESIEASTERSTGVRRRSRSSRRHCSSPRCTPSTRRPSLSEAAIREASRARRRPHDVLDDIGSLPERVDKILGALDGDGRAARRRRHGTQYSPSSFPRPTTRPDSDRRSTRCSAPSGTLRRPTLVVRPTPTCLPCTVAANDEQLRFQSCVRRYLAAFRADDGRRLLAVHDPSTISPSKSSSR